MICRLKFLSRLASNISDNFITIGKVQSLAMESADKPINRGALIVVEGCDKCGKSTQSSLLVKYLKSQNVSVEHMAFPNRKSASGLLINAYLTNKQDMSDESIHLLFAVNRWEVQKEMKKLLNAGTTLVVDRYSYSGVAYSAAKGLSLDWCSAPERGLIRPDMVFYLQTGVETLTSREKFGNERYEKVCFQKKVAQIFDEIYQKEHKYWKKIDASQSTDNIHEQISVEAMKLIDDVKHKNLDILWKL